MKATIELSLVNRESANIFTRNLGPERLFITAVFKRLNEDQLYVISKGLVKLERWADSKKEQRIKDMGGISLQLKLNEMDIFMPAHFRFVKLYEIKKFGYSGTFPVKAEA